MARDLGYRRNQWPAGVSMVQLYRRFAALRVRDGRPAQLRRIKDGDWTPLPIASVDQTW